MTPRVRQAVVAVTALLAVAVVCAVAWPPRPGADARPVRPEARDANAPAPASALAPPASPAPARLRDVFTFADRAPEAPEGPLPRLLVPPPGLEPPPALAPPDRPLRLVGFVRRGNTLRAALALSGNVVVLGPGDEADGYAVLAVDEDAGVTVRSPDGAEHRLAPPGS